MLLRDHPSQRCFVPHTPETRFTSPRVRSLASLPPSPIPPRTPLLAPPINLVRRATPALLALPACFARRGLGPKPGRNDAHHPVDKFRRAKCGCGRRPGHIGRVRARLQRVRRPKHWWLQLVPDTIHGGRRWWPISALYRNELRLLWRNTRPEGNVQASLRQSPPPHHRSGLRARRGDTAVRRVRPQAHGSDVRRQYGRARSCETHPGDAGRGTDGDRERRHHPLAEAPVHQKRNVYDHLQHLDPSDGPGDDCAGGLPEPHQQQRDLRRVFGGVVHASLRIDR